jgi:hypothetical protein
MKSGLNWTIWMAAVAAAIGGLIGGGNIWAIEYKAVDLTPSGFTSTEAYGISGTQQGGYGNQTPSSLTHAFLWSD